MNLKNYTSSVPAFTTISYIESYLASCGVTGISKQYHPVTKQPEAIFFHIDMPPSRYTIKLPAQVDAVLDFIWHDYVESHSKHRKLSRCKEDFRDQATRTAWKIQQDWVQVQMSLIKLKQADFLQVFMGYLWDGKQSYYQAVEASKFKALPQYSS
jgi:hypothetical protein